MSYVDEIIELVVRKNPAEPEFHQAVKEVMESLRVVIEANEEAYRRDALLERIVNPERQIIFRVPWVDDKGQVQVNTGYRVQFNNAIGPDKGGLKQLLICSMEPLPIFATLMIQCIFPSNLIRLILIMKVKSQQQNWKVFAEHYS